MLLPSSSRFCYGPGGQLEHRVVLSLKDVHMVESNAVFEHLLRAIDLRTSNSLFFEHQPREQSLY